ncbi:leucoanthocyanidin dioxygenase 1-like [Triticum dicoccoides]|uniref:leucoanthocyanidin dioxygenase 1-like n=1 Tax=Triticum dicoccoides TaxID=85692 RepID=UPI000E7BBFD7|nr:leucoanthocyanidin dioxygenase 1-like [Triticum dicoccoides]
MARVEALSMSGATAIPAEYVRPEEERQGLGDAYDEAAASWSAAGSPRIPVVDVAGFDAADPASPSSLAVVDAVRAAAEEWGVMHVAGHSIPEDLIDALRGAGTGFFRMPIEDKEAYANDPAAGKLEGYGSRLAGSAGEDGKREWEDYLFHMLHPDARADHALWPAHPPEYVPVTKTFGEHVSALSSRLLAILSLGLGVPADTLERRLRLTSGEAEAQVEDDLLLKLKINYYPRCPQPELAVGVEAHTDVSALSFILTNGVPGLQVLLPGDGQTWVTARDEPGTLVVHVGDALEILSNGRYTSVLHRGLVNRQAVRVSWVVFAEPPPDSVLLRPLPELLADGSETPRFEPCTFRQHLERKVLKKNNDQHEEEVKKPPVAVQEKEKEEATKPPLAAQEEEKEEATKPPVAGEEQKVVKKEQGEQEEAKMAPVAANLVEVN